MVEGLSELLGSWTTGLASHAVACVIVKGAGEKVWRTGLSMQCKTHEARFRSYRMLLRLSYTVTHVCCSMHVGVLRWWGCEEVCGGGGCVRTRGPPALLRLRVQNEPAGKSRGARSMQASMAASQGQMEGGLVRTGWPSASLRPDPSMSLLPAADSFRADCHLYAGSEYPPHPYLPPSPLAPADLTAFSPLHRADGWRCHGRRCGRLGARPVQGRNREVSFDQQCCVITPYESGLAMPCLATTWPPCRHCRRAPHICLCLPFSGWCARVCRCVIPNIGAPLPPFLPQDGVCDAGVRHWAVP